MWERYTFPNPDVSVETNQECLEFFNIPEAQSARYFLMDNRWNLIHYVKTYLRAIYPFRRSVSPQLNLVHVLPDKGQELIQKQVNWLRTQFPSLDIEVDGGVGPDTIHKCAEAGANMIVSGSAVMKSDDPRSVINLLRNVCVEAIQKRSLDR
ncbi:UNVERIFIED_CONTAM: hypothetical protein FKN15_044680 [Acipenser sinensis]